MIRTKVKGTRFKAASSPENEPDFYSMPIVLPLTPEMSSCDDSQNAVTAPSSGSALSTTVVPFLSTSFSQDFCPSMQPVVSSLNEFLTMQFQNNALVNNPATENHVTSNDCNDCDYQDDLDDFSIEWSDEFDAAFENSLNDDVQLSAMLEKLLED